MSTTPTPLFEEFDPVPIEEWKDQVAEETGRSAVDEFLTWASLDGVSIPSYRTRTVLDAIPHVESGRSLPPLAESEGTPANEWTICQLIDHPDPETANQLAREAVDGGVSDLKLAATRPDDHSSPSVNSVAELATLLGETDLTETGIHLGNGPASLVLYTALRQHLQNRDVDAGTVGGSVAFDPVAALARGTVSSVDRAFDLAADTFDDASDLPNFRTVTVDTGVYHDAGASAVQELAFALGALTERLARSTEREAPLPQLLDDLHVHVPISTSYFVEIGKLRALRLLVPQVVEPFLSSAEGKPSFSTSDVHVHAETSRRTETIYDPYVNMLRGTTEALAATVGGCDRLTVRRYDAATQTPDSFGNRIARNTQLILRHEAHTDQVADPAAGSYYIETLTDRLAQNAWARFQELEENGGIVTALQTGRVQEAIEERRRARIEALDRRQNVLVGTSHYPDPDERRLDGFSSSDRDSSPSPGSDDVASLEAIRQALDRGASVGEVVRRLRQDASEIDPLPRIRLAENVESVRLRTESFAEAHGEPPRVLLAPMGPPSARSARANFARNFLGVAGFEIDDPLKFDTVEDAAVAAEDNDVDVVVLCSSNDRYPTLAPALRDALDERNREAILVVAGSPEEVPNVDVADVFVHQGSSLIGTLEDLQSRLGISVGSRTP